MRRPGHRPRPGHALSPAAPPPRLQPLTRARVATLGEPGAAWVAALPRVLDELAERWSLTYGRALPGGSASYVVTATTAAGEPRVVKVVLPEPETVTADGAPGTLDEARTLAAAAGHGYALLHGRDDARGALLLEALGPSLEQRPLPPERKLAILADTLREAWRVPLATAPAPAPGADRASTLHRLVVDLDARLPGACDPRVLAQALAYAGRRAADHDPAACVVVHGDPHPANALRVAGDRPGAPAGHVLVDPDGFRADPAYDLGVALRDWTGRLRGAGSGARALLEGYADVLARHTGTDPRRVWEWGFLERVSTGLYVTGFGARDVGRRFLDSATLLLDRPVRRRPPR